MPRPSSTSCASVWSDEDFLRAFLDLSVPADLFRHREHLRLAWLLLKSSDVPTAAERMCDGIRRFAHHHGATRKYHHTLTLAWMRLVASAVEEMPEGETFRQFMDAHPELCDKNLLSKYYSNESLETAAARQQWIDPDLQPLPTLRSYRQG
jgi:hypothetical protein